MATQVKDFIYNYRPQSAKDIQTYISGRYEFRQLASDIKEPIPKRGEKYTHQEFIVRYMKAYDRLLMMHDTGTGKSCGSLGSAESFREEWLSSTADYVTTYLRGQPGNIRRVVIFTKSETLEYEFRNQLVCKCTKPETYEQRIRGTKQGQGAENAITRSLGKFYDFERYGAFGNAMKKMPMSDTVLKQKYSNTLFICDEIQDLITGNRANISEKDKEDDKSSYAALQHLFRVVPDIKVILMSATPMIDQAREIIPIMNLILPENNQIPQNIDLSTATLEQMEPYFRGMVSFVRALDTGAVPVYQGDALSNQIGVKVFKSPMVPDGIQRKSYIQYANGELVKNSFESNTQQAGLFVFPNGSIGTKGMETYFISGGDGTYQWVHDDVLARSNIPSLSRQLEGPNALENLRRMSTKFATVIDLLTANSGSHFIYTDYVEVGTNILGLILDRFQLNGQYYERFTGKTAAFNKSFSGNMEYCSAGSSTGQISPGFMARPRYAIINSGVNGKQRQNILELMNSPANMYGDYIKVLVVSRTARTGINVNNIQSGHLLGPSWNQSNTYQALSRFLRATSHAAIIEDIMIKEHKKLEDVRLTVNIYQHCIVDNISHEETVDEHLYRLSAEKDYDIKRIFRFMKQCAVDCQIHKRRNVRLTDEPYTAVCDYQECDYACVDPEPTSVDYSAFNAIYSDGDVNRVIDIIKDYFKTHYQVSYNEMVSWVGKNIKHDTTEVKFLTDRAIRQLVDRRKVIYDRYNFRCYLQEDGANLYIQRDFPTDTTGTHYASLSYYASSVIGIKTKSLDVYLRSVKANIAPEITNIINGFKDILDLYFYLRTLDIDTMSAILEDAMVNRCIRHNTEDRVSEWVIRCLSPYIYWFAEPIAELEAQKLSIEPSKLEKAAKQGVGFKKKNVVRVDQQAIGGWVYIHTLYGLETGGVEYNTTAKKSRSLNKMRIMNASDGYFREAMPYEISIYIPKIQEVKKERIQPYTDQSLYGIYDSYTQLFRLVDLTKNTTIGDLRSDSRGKVCKDWSPIELINILKTTGYKLKPSTVTESQMRNELAKTKIDTMGMDAETLRYAYAYQHSTSIDICDILLGHFADIDRLYIE